MEIKAKDLRIGNLHKTNEISIPRLQIHSAVVSGTAYASISAYGIHLVDANEMVFEPIHITEEWLVRLGFEKIKYGWFEKIFHTDCYMAFISGDKNGYTEVCLFPYENHFRWQYVHQLQNAYYSLTGEELTITP